uniref:Major facilitator superfamily (MFS) profile domain-containing protein n=1 Tax=Plectus sambesii TaxID=2011161 RepID=A0A914WSA3_9BILA
MLILREKLAVAFHVVFGSSAALYNSMTNLEADGRNFLHEVLSERDGGRAPSDAKVAIIWSSITAAYAIGAFCGSFFIHTLMDSLGRRNTLMRVQNSLLIVGGIAQFCARPSRLFELLLLGRLLCGVAYALTTFSPTFLAECLAKKDHGTAGLMQSLSWATMIGIGTLLPQMFSPPTWHYVYLIPLIPSAIHAALSFSFPDSPKHIYMRHFDTAGAKRALSFYRGADFDWDDELKHMNAERLLDTSTSFASLKHILAKPVLRSPFLLVIAVGLMASCGGIDIAHQYSTSLMVGLHIGSNVAPLISGLGINLFCGMIGVIIGYMAERRTGRRQFVLGCSLMCVLSSSLLSITDVCSGALQQIVGVAGLITSTVSFYAGMTYLPGILAAEMCPYLSRSITVGVNTGASWLLAISVIVLFMPLKRQFGSFSILPLSVAASALWLFLYRNLPETKGRALDDIAQMWTDTETKPIIAEDGHDYGTRLRRLSDHQGH